MFQVGSDGNCMFSAIRAQMSTNDHDPKGQDATAYDADQLRIQIVRFMVTLFKVCFIARISTISIE